MTEQVVVVIGVGGMGEAIARRQGPGRKLLVADFNEETLESLASSLKSDGYDVSAHHVDVGSPDSVHALAQAAASAGAVTQLVHTAGLSPTQASAEAILRVDLFGVAAVLEVFGEVIAADGAGVVIASMAGHMMGDLSPDQQKDLATASLDRLLALSYLQSDHVSEPGHAYAVAKYANRLRVMAESVRWGKRGARLNSISPGVIATPMGREELGGDSGLVMRAMVDASGTARLGTPFDIANAAAFLLGPESTFITGTDILVDGGVVAAIRAGALGG
jgi:meso-butanediol dehydrogenase/(S,S)-butanediol dehydrogenase/diacetyl reductase